MVKLACRADLEYNKATKYVMPERCGNIPWRDERKVCSSVMSDILPHKVCSTCNQSLPATSEYFNRRKASKDGLQHKCKNCRLDYENRNREHTHAVHRARDNRPEVRERRHAREKARRTNPETRADFLAMKRASWARCQPHLKEYYSRPEVRAMKRANNKKREHDPVIGPQIREQKRIRTLNYLAHKKSASGTYTLEQIQEQLKHQKYCCYYAACGHAKFEKSNGKYVYHIDHTFPLTREGASNDISYLVLACPSCNQSKGNKYPWEWPEGGKLL